MRGSAWRLYLGAGALATGVYYLLPGGPRAVLNVLVGASAIAVIALGVRWHRPDRRLPLWLIMAAQGLFVAGDALFSVNELVLHIESFPSLADALYLPGYPVLAAGLAVLAFSPSPGRRDWAGRAGADPDAAELHDGPIQRLSVLSYDLERAKQGCSPTRPRWPASSTPRRRCPPRSRGCGS